MEGETEQDSLGVFACQITGPSTLADSSRSYANNFQLVYSNSRVKLVVKDIVYLAYYLRILLLISEGLPGDIAGTVLYRPV